MSNQLEAIQRLLTRAHTAQDRADLKMLLEFLESDVVRWVACGLYVKPTGGHVIKVGENQTLADVRNLIKNGEIIQKNREI